MDNLNLSTAYAGVDCIPDDKSNQLNFTDSGSEEAEARNDGDENDPWNAIKLDQTFGSFAIFEAALAGFQVSTSSVFYRRDSCTVSHARRKGVKKPINDELKYYSAKYNCIHGGKLFKSKSTGARSTG